MQRNPIKEPKVGDKWERLHFYITINEVSGHEIKLTEFRKEENSFSCNLNRDFESFQKMMNYKGFDCWNFVGNEKEKEMTNTENQTERERAITSPQIGDRWVFSDGVSIEIYDLVSIDEKATKNNVCYVTSDRKISYFGSSAWRHFVHAAKFVDNFAPKTTKTESKRDPLKDPKAGDKWEVTELWHNYKEVVYKGQHLMITKVKAETNDTYIYGYFTNGLVFNCSLGEFPARSQVFKFVGNTNE